MFEEELKFVDDKLFVYTPLLQYGDGICKVQLVMTKEIFQECYKRWVEPQANEINQKEILNALLEGKDEEQRKIIEDTIEKMENLGSKKQAQADGEYITQSAGDEIRQKNYDLISRQAMLDYLKANIDDFPDYHEAMEKVLQMPSVKPQEPKTGHWVDREVYDADRWKCSECGRTESYKENYCPSCGSYNGGEQHDSM